MSPFFLEFTSMTEHDRATDRRAVELVAEIEQLVRIAARRPGLVVVKGEPDCTWSFNWADDVVTVNPDHVRQFAPDFCRGLALHEAAHAAVTRLHDILSWSLLRLYLPLLNTIEDIRIETWMRARFPGAMPWVRAYNDSIFAGLRSIPLPRSRAVQFLRSVLELWWYGSAPEGILPEVAAALVTCQEPISQAAACQPPVQDDEAGIMASQRAMWEIVRARIMPSWERLIALDRREGIVSQAMEEFCRFTRAAGHGSSRRGPVRRRVGRRPATATTGNTATSGSARTAAARSISAALRTDGSDDYLAAWKRIAHLADPLGDALLRTLVPRRRLRWSTGHASGTRLDLRRAMAFDIDPTDYRSLWMRPVVPGRRDPAVAVLLDRSGSMAEHGLIDRAFEGLVLLLEVCRRLGVPVAAWSFARHCREELGWETPLDEPARRRLGRIPRAAVGRTDMETALVTVGESLARRSADPKILFVISDGCPDDATATALEIANLEAAGIVPIGLGLGPGTADLSLLFSASETEIPAERIVESVARLLSETLLARA
jgi:hypothetical protein